MSPGDATPTVRFSSTLEQSGKTATGIEVPAEVVETLGAGKRPPVRVEVNGHAYPSTVATMGGRFMISVSAENREAAGVAAGDELDVALTLDTAPREVTVPADFAAELAQNPTAEAFFDTLSSSETKFSFHSATRRSATLVSSALVVVATS